MNVLLLNTNDTGGAAIACIRLHKALLKAGVQSKILFLQKKNNNLLESYDFMEAYKNRSKFRWIFKHIHYYTDLAYKAQKTASLKTGYEPFQFPSSVFDITQHPLYEWADIINLHWVANFLDWPSFFRQNKKPVVWTLHDMLPFTGGYHYESGFQKESYRHLITSNLMVKKKALIEKSINVVTLNHWIEEKVASSSLFHRYPRSIIPNSINTQIFQPYDQQFARQVFDLPPNKKVLLFVSEVVTNERKGFIFLEEALIHLSEDVLLGTLGVCNNSLIDNKSIIQFGAIKDERLMALAYSAADLFVIPSIEDNLPNTIIESTSCGTPVVGFNIGGIPDMIVEGRNGFLCEDINGEALAKTIIKALYTNFEKEWIRNDTVNRYNQSLQAKRYVELFQTLL